MNKRKEKAKYLWHMLREIEDAEIFGKRRHHLRCFFKLQAARQFGYPKKPCLADFYPLRNRGGWLICSKLDDDGCGWRFMFSKGHVPEEDCHRVFSAYDGGPGRPYAKRAHVKHNKYSTLVYQRIGWDI